MTLIQYVLEGGFEVITNEKGRIIKIKDVEVSEEYIPLKGVFKRYAVGSTPSINNLLEDTEKVKIQNHLITGFTPWGFLPTISKNVIEKINKDFEDS